MLNNSRPHRSALLGACIGVAFLVGACGGGSSEPAGTPSAQTSATQASDAADSSTGAEVVEPTSAPDVVVERDASGDPRADLSPALATNGGVIVVDAVEYQFETERCTINGDAISHEGFGVTDDGTPFTVRVSTDGTTTVAEVTLGQIGIARRITPDLPKYSVDTFTDPDMTVTLDGLQISGSGQGADSNAGLADRKTIPIAFVAHCE